MRLVLQLTDDRIKKQYGIRCVATIEGIREAFRLMCLAVINDVLPDFDDDNNIEWLDSKKEDQ